VQSRLYEGRVVHVRREPRLRSFSYRLAYLYLDLAEIGEVFAGSRLFAAERRAPASFRRADHFGDPDLPLDEAVRRLVAERSGVRPSGPIRLLTQPQWFGLAFNPISLFFCWDRDGEELEAIVAEVTNIPWRERHCYVLPVSGAEPARDVLRFRVPKAMHVSPFLDMDYEYEFRIGRPGEALRVSVANLRGERREFEATLSLERRALDPAALRRAFWRQTIAPTRVLAAIHWQALRLALRRVRFHAHPRHRAPGAEEAA
jgi:DUF1365 family protein